jgi:hypothetical protein
MKGDILPRLRCLRRVSMKMSAEESTMSPEDALALGHFAANSDRPCPSSAAPAWPYTQRDRK